MEISLQKSNQLKAVAILMMLFLHLFNKPFEGLFQPLLFIGNQPLSYYLSLFGDACVSIFCFVSGYGLYFSYQSNKLYKVRYNLLLIFVLILYVVGFYFRVYRPELFENTILNWFQRQICLYATSLFPFFIGALALKKQWNTKINHFLMSFRFKNAMAVIGILVLVIVHGIIPNFIIAPFLGIPFVFFFVQLQLPVILARALDFLAPHATNLWLTHMFFYMVYFEDLIYGAKYVAIIFLLLFTCSLLSSIVVNVLNSAILQKIKLK